MTVDIDALAAVVAAMTPGEWSTTRHRSDTGAPSDIRADTAKLLAECCHGADAAGVVALRNGAAELIRLARVGQAVSPLLDDLSNWARRTPGDFATAFEAELLATYRATTKEPT